MGRKVRGRSADVGHSALVPGSLRVALTLEQCWHRVPGGTATSTLGMVRALQARDDLDLVGVAAWHRSQPVDPWHPTIPVRHLRVPGTLLYDAWHRTRRPRVERATGPVDVIHATTLAIPPATAPLVVSIHDLAFLDHPDFFTVRGLAFFRRGLQLALDQAAAVLVPSRATRDACRAAGFDEGRLRIAPWGIDARPASEGEIDAARRRYGLTRPYLLFVGTVEPRKNLRRILEAFAQISGEGRPVDLALVGPEGWNEDLAELLEAVGDARDRVQLLGFVPAADLAALYAGSAAFCFPSLQEGFGLPVLEALAQGAPVITSAGTATEEVAGDVALLVEPTDADALAGAIRQVLDNDALVARLRAAGPVQAARFSWEACAAVVAGTYRAVAT